jgi:chemotaxis signal transduction protein
MDAAQISRAEPPAAVSAASPAARAGTELRQLVVAGAMRFVIGFDESREYIDSLASLTRIPRSPVWLLGAFNADGNAVPLVDISAWAHQVQPVGWRSQGQLSGGHFEGPQSGGASIGLLRALRMGDGPDAWAIRVTEAPSVISLSQDQSRAISSALPLAVSSANGHLMPHTSTAWLLPDDVIALQIRWAALAEALRQELAGVTSVERRKE